MGITSDIFVMGSSYRLKARMFNLFRLGLAYVGPYLIDLVTKCPRRLT